MVSLVLVLFPPICRACGMKESGDFEANIGPDRIIRIGKPGTKRYLRPRETKNYVVSDQLILLEQ
jgi:hypothetical protein